MKKIMIGIVAVAMAMAVQAGSVAWNSSTMYTVGEAGAFTSSEVANDAVTGTLFMLTYSAWESYFSIYDSDGYAKMAETIYGDYKSGALTSSATGKSLDGIVNLTDGVSYANRTDVYAALVYETKVGDVDYYIANLGDFTAATAKKTVYDMAAYELGSGISGTESPIAGWTAVGGGSSVPEPTSALMLLVGLVGLALKRKVA